MMLKSIFKTYMYSDTYKYYHNKFATHTYGTHGSAAFADWLYKGVVWIIIHYTQSTFLSTLVNLKLIFFISPRTTYITADPIGNAPARHEHTTSIHAIAINS